jgi:hypothetical protein
MALRTREQIDEHALSLVGPGGRRNPQGRPGGKGRHDCCIRGGLLYQRTRVAEAGQRPLRLRAGGLRSKNAPGRSRKQRLVRIRLRLPASTARPHRPYGHTSLREPQGIYKKLNKKASSAEAVGEFRLR